MEELLNEMKLTCMSCNMEHTAYASKKKDSSCCPKCGGTEWISTINLPSLGIQVDIKTTALADGQFLAEQLDIRELN